MKERRSKRVIRAIVHAVSWCQALALAAGMYATVQVLEEMAVPCSRIEYGPYRIKAPAASCTERQP